MRTLKNRVLKMSTLLTRVTKMVILTDASPVVMAKAIGTSQLPEQEERQRMQMHHLKV